MSSYNEQPIIEGKNLNVDTDVSLGKVKVNNSGGKNVPIYNSHIKRNLHLSTPLMLTWGVSKWENEGSKETYDMTLQFPNEDYQTDATTEFLKNMTSLEKYIKKAAMDNSKDWFNISQSCFFGAKLDADSAIKSVVSSNLLSSGYKLLKSARAIADSSYFFCVK